MKKRTTKSLMEIDKFIRNILRVIEGLKNGIIAYAYYVKNGWYEICVNDFDLYTADKRFKTLTKAWHDSGKKRGCNVIFVYCKPREDRLVNLLEDDNLILIVD